MAVKSCEDLIVWQKTMDLTVEIYRLVKFLPREETYALSDQMRRAVVSIPSNISEGYGRYSTKEFINFLFIARGSFSELKYQLQICHRLKYFSESESEYALNLCNEVYKILNALISKLKQKLVARV